MAIIYVGGQTAGRTNPTAALSVNFALTGGVASVPATGDLVIVTCVTGSAAGNPAMAVTTPNDYTPLGQLNQSAQTNDTSLDVSYKFMTATPDTAVTIPGTGNNAFGEAYTIQVFRGVDPTTPMDATPVSAGGTGTGRPDPAAITPVTPGAWPVVCAGGAAGTGATYTAPANYTTNFITANGADTTDAMVGSGYRSDWASGAENPAAYTGGTTGATDSWASYTLALRPFILSAAPAEASKIAEVLLVALTVLTVGITESAKIGESLSRLINPPAQAQPASDTTTIGNEGRVDLLGLGNPLKVVDGPIIAQRLNVISAGLLTESLKVIEVAPSLQLNPIQVAVANEALKVVNVAIGAEIPVGNDLAVQVADESLKVVDGAALRTLDPEQASPSESLKVVDTLTVSVDWATSISESLKIVDSIFGPTLDPEQTTSSESLKVVDTLTAVLSGGVLLEEILRVQETALTSLNPEQATPAESLKVVDQVTTSIGLLATIAEAVKVVDQAQGTLNPEETAVAEALKIVDALSVFINVSATLTDSLRVQDTAQTTLDPEQTTLAEALKVVDQVTTSINLSALLAEALKVVDQLQVSINLAAVLGEGLKVSETVSPRLNPQPIALTEALKVVDELFVTSGGSAAIIGEALRVSDQRSALLTPVQAAPTESLRVSDTVTVALQLASTLNESLKVADTLTASMGLVVVVGEACVVADSAPLAQLNPLLVAISEGLRIDESISISDFQFDPNVGHDPAAAGLGVFVEVASGLGVFIAPAGGTGVFPEATAGLTALPAGTAGLTALPNVGAGVGVFPEGVGGVDVFTEATAALTDVQ